MNRAEKAKYEDLLRKIEDALSYIPPSYFQTEEERTSEKLRYMTMWLDNIHLDIKIHLQIYDEE